MNSRLIEIQAPELSHLEFAVYISLMHELPVGITAARPTLQ